MSIPSRAVETVGLAHDFRGSGPPLALPAGTGYAGATWGDALVERLAERFTIVTIDYRGTGRPPGRTTTIRPASFAADAAGLIDELGLRPAHVLGHSIGGRVAQWVAIDAPDRV